MSTQLSVLFYAKKAKATTDGLVPIYLRVTINGARFEISTKRYVDPAKWSAEGNKVKGNSEESRTINSLLDSLKAKVYAYQLELTREGQNLTLESFKNKWLGIKEKKKMFIETYTAHNEQMKVLVGGDFARATYIKYRTSRQHTQDFIKWKYGCEDIEVDRINYSFVAEYDYYLKSVRKCSHNSAMRYLAHLKKIVYICRKNGWIKQDPFMGFKLTRVEKDKEFLTEKEVERIYLKEFATERLNQVKDIFIFSCFTGLAYSDVQKLKRTEITQGIEGGKWIHTYRRKTDLASRIPILPIAMEIIEKYSEHPQCINHDRVLPVLSNQKMNAYLKEIADICEIHKNLTFHTARHTFATTITLNKGVPIESVGKMLGHRNLRTTQIYAKVLDKKVSDDMLALKDMFNFKRDETKERSRTA